MARTRAEGGAVSIRIRTVNGVRIALCAAETDAASGDLYLDDADHYALSAKYAHDYQGQTIDWPAVEELNRWLAEQEVVGERAWQRSLL